MSLQKGKHDIYLDRPLIAEHGETEANGFRHGKPPVEMLKNREIESRAHRAQFSAGEGDVSIIVQAGTELGDIRVSVQFEGQIGAHDDCLQRQGELLQRVQAWLKEIYANFPGQFTMDIVSEPCPNGDSRRLGLVEVEEQHGVDIGLGHERGVEQ